MTTRVRPAFAPIANVAATAYRVPTDAPEADGTIAWDSTTLVVVELQAGGTRGLGYTYADAAAVGLIQGVLAQAVHETDPLSPAAGWNAMIRAVRNLGRPGLASAAISAVDNAMWDLKGRLLGVPLVDLLGSVRQAVPVYGSGGFTSYDDKRLKKQLSGWVDDGISMVKMKVGANPERDLERVRSARSAIGPHVQLFVDANGGYDRKQALRFAEAFAALDVRWFEEPVSSDDLEGLRLLRDRMPACMDVAAGEYGYDTPYFRRMLQAGAVDVLQADATRCLGVTGFLQAAALADAHLIPLSAHTAPSLHAHLGCALARLRHLEYFHDHVRIERMLFDGAREQENGLIAPDRGRPGLGLELRRDAADRYRI